MSAASEESWEELAKRQLAQFTVTTQEYRAENQRLRDALEWYAGVRVNERAIEALREARDGE